MALSSWLEAECRVSSVECRVPSSKLRNPSSEIRVHVFPLIADPASYAPNTIDLVLDAAGRAVWLGIFRSHYPGLMKLAAASEGDTPEAGQ